MLTGSLVRPVASLLGYSTIAIFTVCAISRSNPFSQFSGSSFPGGRFTKSLIVRSISLPAWVAPRGGCELTEDLSVTVLSPYPFHMVDQARPVAPGRRPRTHGHRGAAGSCRAAPGTGQLPGCGWERH